MNGRSILSETSTLDFFDPQNHRLLTTAILLGAHSYDKTGTSAFFDVACHPRSDARLLRGLAGIGKPHTAPTSRRIHAAGNAVALTSTLEDSYGAKAVVAGAGFLLNNEMGDFNLIPGRTDTSGRIGTPANIIRPRQTESAR